MIKRLHNRNFIIEVSEIVLNTFWYIYILLFITFQCGVMSCSRKECGNIMCDTYVPNIGYICYDCKTEFINFIESSHNSSELSDEKIRTELEMFMGTRRGHYDEEKININHFFDRYTR